ncbi:AAA family ATPase [Bradyrhizobium sp. SZCCHNS3053]|uniref:AAA family ATPase n=1 Tax=Bradyrhizobium sp. SZCCHNS3053 TaxID=3057322 RepID=UPI002916C512|nr:AAA family ATPase [Bradyrhizobium sp. SZCCHNS3053]
MAPLVINLIGGPGAGKSTTAAGLFFLMKSHGLRAELVTEYAKELVYDESWRTLKSQLHVLSEQERRQRRLVDKVDYIITDAPLLTAMAYTSDPRDFLPVSEAATTLFSTYNNVNFVIRRTKPYAAYGRNQTEDEAKVLDQTLIEGIWANQAIDLIVSGDMMAPQVIFDHLKRTRLMF